MTRTRYTFYLGLGLIIGLMGVIFYFGFLRAINQ